MENPIHSQVLTRKYMGLPSAAGRKKRFFFWQFLILFNDRYIVAKEIYKILKHYIGDFQHKHKEFNLKY